MDSQLESEDWSRGWAHSKDGRPECWGTYLTPELDVVRLYRGKYNRCRFYDEAGTQHEAEQTNVIPAMVGAMEVLGWVPLD